MREASIFTAEMEQQVGEIDQANEAIAARAVERVASIARGGLPVADLEEAEPSLHERLERRARAVRQLATMQRASEKLKSEVDHAQSEVNRAAYVMEDAAAKLLLLVGERIAQEVLAYEAGARDARFRLQGLARLWLARSGRLAAIKLGMKALGTLNDLALNDSRRQCAHDPAVAELQRWQAIAAALLVDPEAAFPMEEEHEIAEPRL